METGNVKGACHKTSKTESGIFRGIFLEISRFVGFVNDDEAKIFDRREEGGARADDNLGRSGV